MGKTVLFALVAGTKVLLTKLFAVGLVLLSFAVKGRDNKDEKQWNRYFLHLSEDWVKGYTVGIYTVSGALSSLVSYWMLLKLNFQKPLQLAAALFAACGILSALRYKIKEEDVLKEKLAEVKKFAGEAEECEQE